jgi:hypothetical protein
MYFFVNLKKSGSKSKGCVDQVKTVMEAKGILATSYAFNLLHPYTQGCVDQSTTVGTLGDHA